MEHARTSQLRGKVLIRQPLRPQAPVYGKVIAWSLGSVPHRRGEAQIDTNSRFLPPYVYGVGEKFQYLYRSKLCEKCFSSF
jgi:hypothetical protein